MGSAGTVGDRQRWPEIPGGRGWDSRCGTCPCCALLPWMLLPMSSKEIFRFCGSFAVVFSRKFLTFTKVCERHPGLMAEGEVGVKTQGVTHLDVPLGGTPHSAQCHLGLNWLFPGATSILPSWDGPSGRALCGSPKTTAGMDPHAPHCSHRGCGCRGASWPPAPPGTAASAHSAGASPPPPWPWQNRPRGRERRTTLVGKMNLLG